MGRRKIEDGEALGNRGISPLGELGMFLAPGRQGGFQEPLGFRPVRGVEDRAQLPGHGLSGFLPGDELSGILLQMELATLPGSGRQYRPSGGLEPQLNRRQ